MQLCFDLGVTLKFQPWQVANKAARKQSSLISVVPLGPRPARVAHRDATSEPVDLPAGACAVCMNQLFAVCGAETKQGVSAASPAHVGAVTDETRSEELRRLLTRCPWTAARAAEWNQKEAVDPPVPLPHPHQLKVALYCCRCICPRRRLCT